MLNNGYRDDGVINAQMTTEKAYWMKTLSGELMKSYFPFDYIRPENSERKMKTEKFKIQEEICLKLLKLSSSSDVKLHMILSAALTTLLGEYTGMEDIMIGTPIYKQKESGEFINTVLVLRNQLKAEMSFKDFLVQVSRTIIGAIQNQNYPIENLIYELDISTKENGCPLFDTVILLDSIHDRNYINNINPNMIFSFCKCGDYIEGELEYNSMLYKQETAKNIIKHFLKMIYEVMTNINTKISDLDILLEEEKNCLLNEFNNSSCKYEQDKTVAQIFEDQVIKTPNKQAVVCDGMQLKYKELNEKSNYIAKLLRDKGVKPGSIVALMIDKSLEMIIGILGILKAGGAYLPIDINYPCERVGFMLNDSGAEIILTTSKVVDKFPFDLLQKVKTQIVPSHFSEKREPIVDFNSLPIPDRTLIDYDKYSDYIGQAMVKNSIAIQATRGCPYECAYCCRIWSKSHVLRSAENIFNEIQIYYNIGVRRFVFIDDIFNLDMENGKKLFKLIIKNGLKIQMFFPNGMRGDILTKDYIDLMVEAGTVNVALSLETASPRLQKYLNKNIDLQKFKENVEYITTNYENFILDLFTMHGFPTESEEEAMMTLDFIKSIQWIHFPTTEVLKIYPGTDIERMAIESGISKENIELSMHLPDGELPLTLPFSREFTIKYQTLFLNEYFLKKERLLHVLPIQMKIVTEDELVKKYQSYLPIKIRDFDHLLEFVGISRKELGNCSFMPEGYGKVADFTEKIREVFPVKEYKEDSLRVLFLDLSCYFSSENENKCVINEPPLGQMYLLTYLNQRFGSKIMGKVAKSGVDFDSYEELKTLISDFKPDLIGIRSLSLYQNFFHKTVSYIKQWAGEASIISGGPYATSECEKVLKDRNVNLVILGEGEVTFGEIIEKTLENENRLPSKKVLKSIKGIAFIDDTEISEEKQFNREIIMMDNLPEKLSCDTAQNPEVIGSPNNLAYIIYTSGTTGNPKGVMIENKGISNLQSFFKERLGITEDDRIIQFANSSFDASVWETFMALLTGSTLYIVPKDTILNQRRFEDFLNSNEITVATLPPTYLSNICPNNVRFLKKLITAGSATNFELLNKWNDKVEYINAYGPTETTICATVWKNDNNLKSYNSIPIGKPIANTRCYIVDKNKKLKMIGVEGELCISGDGLARGYLNRPDLSNEKFVDNPYEKNGKMYKTGDLARWLPNGNIEFLGRTDHQIKIRGYRVEIGEIEAQILKHKLIKEVAVVVKDNKADTKELCAYIVHNEKLSVNEIRDYLTSILPNYMIPSYFISMEKIPLTPNGKVDVKALPTLDSITSNEGEYKAPRNEAEERMVLIWEEILGVNKIGIKDNFFFRGGDSIKAIQICSRLREASFELEVKDLFQFPTIGELCQNVKIASNQKDEDKLSDDPDYFGVTIDCLDDLTKKLSDKIQNS